MFDQLLPKSKQILKQLLLLFPLMYVPMAQAGPQADRAVSLVRELIESGEITSGTTLNLVIKQGNISNFLGEGHELKSRWEALTGTFIDASVMPQLASHEFIRTQSGVDITIARNREYPDLVRDGLIKELTPLLKRYDFELDNNMRDGYLLPELQARFDGRVYAIPADGDVALLYLRRDLLQDEANRAAFKKRYSRELEAPQTWDDYLRLVDFFHRPEEGFYGALEPREPLTAWMYWMPRYVSQQYPNQYLFDEEMRPLINSPAGIEATESFIKTVPFSPPQILEQGKDYSYTLPFFLKGQGFATIITIAGAKLFNVENSAVRGRFVVVPMPGNRVGDRLVRRSTFIYGNNIVIPSDSKQPLLAFLYAMWVTDPDISVDAVGVRTGFSDPYRYNHLKDERIIGVYTDDALQRLRQSLPEVVPAGTGLPGDDQYIAALNQNLWLAAKGKLSAAEAMEKTASAWDRITDQLGRQQQKAFWHRTRQLYPNGENDR